ncbi:MAG TPA: hypothetical protein VNO79_09140 [Actinomycetota bacterium]|nr:hypothetical protein [Actinomycetota bacterium]
MSRPQTDEFLERLARYREAARTCVRADAPVARRLLALVKVTMLAREEEDPTLRAWAERVVYEEARPLLGDGGPPEPGDPWERAQRQLRREGYERCPRCWARVATDEELDRAQLERERRLRELEGRAR